MESVGARNTTPDPMPLQVPRMTVPVHGLTRYLRAQLEVRDGVLRWEVPRTVLGILQFGVRHISVPVGDIRSLRVHRVARPVNLLVGVALIVVPLAFGLWWAALPAVVFGVWVVLVSLGPRLEAVTHGGAKRHASVCFSHRIDAELYMAAVTDVAEHARRLNGEG